MSINLVYKSDPIGQPIPDIGRGTNKDLVWKDLSFAVFCAPRLAEHSISLNSAVDLLRLVL